MKSAGPILRYVLFAVIATAVNLLTQRLSLWAYDGAASLMIAIIAGTAAGLILKYLLDKYYVFNDARSDLAVHGRQFALYTAMGLITTVIFWATEYSFWLIWQTHMMREIGAILGLGVGYVTKYHLDRRFVFAAPERLVS